MSISPTATLAGGVLLSLLVVAVWMCFRPKVSPAELERRRRRQVYLNGRIRDAEVTEVRDWFAYYTYSVAGVTYTASQDIAPLHESLPEDPSLLVGPAGVKYLAQNPADSIVICEEWSGLRVPPARRPAADEAPETVPPHSAEQI